MARRSDDLAVGEVSGLLQECFAFFRNQEEMNQLPGLLPMMLVVRFRVGAVATESVNGRSLCTWVGSRLRLRPGLAGELRGSSTGRNLLVAPNGKGILGGAPKCV